MANNLELLQWGDGTIRLAFWDSLHGDDKIFILEESGQAFISEYTDDSDEEVRIPVDLVAELRKLAEGWITKHTEQA